MGAGTCRNETVIPEWVNLDDGIAEQEAIALALWNSPQYQELLADLGISQAAVIEAGQLSNPEFWAVFPVGVKQLEFALNLPVEALWLRPKRLAAAELESQRIGNRLVQDGLDLVRDVRLAHADLVLAQEQLGLARESAGLRTEMAKLAEARLRSGVASELDVMTARIEKSMDQERAERQAHNVELARQRLGLLMGIELGDATIEAAATPKRPEFEQEADSLVDQALASRPDLWAARFSLRAARQRAKLAKLDYLKLVAVFPDANGDGKKGFEAGPGVTFTVPLLHQNQGARFGQPHSKRPERSNSCGTRPALSGWSMRHAPSFSWRRSLSMRPKPKAGLSNRLNSMPKQAGSVLTQSSLR